MRSRNRNGSTTPRGVGLLTLLLTPLFSVCLAKAGAGKRNAAPPPPSTFWWRWIP